MVKFGKATDLFKPLKKGDRLTVVYVHSDGHAVAGFERRIRDADTSVRYYKQVDAIGFRCRFNGRLIFSDMSGGTALLRLWMQAGMASLYARPATMDGGSENTKKAGIPVGYLSAQIPDIGEVHDHAYPTLISGAWTYQEGPEWVETFDRDLESFGGSNSHMAETIITVQHPLQRSDRY